MDNVRPLRTKDISPEIVLNSLMKMLPDMVDIHVCVIDKTGSPIMFSSGDLGTLCTAAIAMQNLACLYLNGEIDEE